MAPARSASLLVLHLRQLGDVGSDAPGLVAGEEMRRRAERRDHGLLQRNRDGVATRFEMFGTINAGSWFRLS
jgi:hypothetical protein